MDYQNIHLTAHDRFCPGGEARHLCLIHPLHYALQIVDQRNLILRLMAEKSGKPFVPCTLGTVTSFRGQPSNRRDPNGYRRSQAQQSHWTRDPRARVRYRALKYYSRSDGGYDIKEKGVDVLVALELVQRAAAAEAEQAVVILAAHDTDQEPALELANRLAPGRIETSGWQDEKRLKIPGVQMWHTYLDQNRFERCIDRKDYT
ncbi:hypothetical protein QWJ41_14900 [Nocardioides sp. SOB44]|uniref:NYN domain-containing protein n=1 Tax=Nocardioides cremeus TaxID=3058044 RepID=A0ABT8TST5_9ACTN|nr:hypothetical protein [Nocardioides cremeus]MDO3397013.1 hypothetical protein [Nocardioides cremeus]